MRQCCLRFRKKPRTRTNNEYIIIRIVVQDVCHRKSRTQRQKSGRDWETWSYLSLMVYQKPSRKLFVSIVLVRKAGHESKLSSCSDFEQSFWDGNDGRKVNFEWSTRYFVNNRCEDREIVDDESNGFILVALIFFFFRFDTRLYYESHCKTSQSSQDAVNYKWRKERFTLV